MSRVKIHSLQFVGLEPTITDVIYKGNVEAGLESQFPYLLRVMVQGDYRGQNYFTIFLALGSLGALIVSPIVSSRT